VLLETNNPKATVTKEKEHEIDDLPPISQAEVESNELPEDETATEPMAVVTKETELETETVLPFSPTDVKNDGTSLVALENDKTPEERQSKRPRLVGPDQETKESSSTDPSAKEIDDNMEEEAKLDEKDNKEIDNEEIQAEATDESPAHDAGGQAPATQMEESLETPPPTTKMSAAQRRRQESANKAGKGKRAKSPIHSNKPAAKGTKSKRKTAQERREENMRKAKSARDKLAEEE